MSFYGNSFIFNRIPSELFGLVIYEIDGKHSGSDSYSGIKLVEDKINTKVSALHYGINYSENLSFKLVFGVLNGQSRIDFYDTSVISGWLMGHSQYKWLEICQSDMTWVRYRCLITNIEKVSVAGMTVAFSCDVECDSPFAYSYPHSEIVNVAGVTNYIYKNISSYNGYLCPTIKLTPAIGVSTISIKNKSDDNRIMSVGGIKDNSIITFDCNKQVISDNLNSPLYDSFNDIFLRCVRGDNILEITGNCVMEIISEFNMNIGA